MKASDWIVGFLASQGVDHLFGYIGGTVTHLVDSAAKETRLRFIQTYHEQSAAFAAEGYAREKGIPGVAIATSGPGATNMLTGVANAYFDSVPVLYVTGQVNTYEYKYGKPVRQQGFQETDVVSMAAPVTKYAVLIDRPERVCYEFEKAWRLAQSGRPGPVLIDLPMDIQRAEIEPERMEHFVPEEETAPPGPDIASIVEALRRSRRPLLLIGGGCHHAKLRSLLAGLLETGMPAVVSLQGKGAIPEDGDGFAGMLGSYGNRSANLATARADLLLVLGSRLDTRQTGAARDAFGEGRRIIQIDVDAAEMAHHRLPGREVHLLKLDRFLTLLNQFRDALQAPPEWRDEIRFLKENYSQRREVDRFVDNRLPYDALSGLAEQLPNDTIFTADVGQNQMWAAQTLRLRGGQDFLTSGGMAPMGYAIPAAIGAALAAGGRKRVVAVTGDGGFQIALQSLPLISQYNLPVTVAVMNNRSLGMITQFQALYFNSNFAATTEAGGYLPPDCEALAKAFSLPFRRTAGAAEFAEAVRNSGRSGVIELAIIAPTVVSPKLEYDRPFYDMSPPLPPDELQSVLAPKRR